MLVELPLIVLSSLVIFSYLFDLVARQFKIPSVILLLLSGIGLNFATTYFNIKTANFLTILPLLGTVGLILIVLEGALELKIEKEKSSVIKKALGSAFFILLITTLAIGFLFYYISDQSFRICLLNAVPLSIISSAIAIPSASALPGNRKEFVIYESSLSDIFGIILFNFLLSNDTITGIAFVHLGLDTLFIILISLIFCLFLLYILKRINHHLKFFLIIAVLLLVYAVGKYYHLSSLVVILAFGLFLNNIQLLKHPTFTRIFAYEKFDQDLQQMIQLTGESAFIVRTFFFLIFGFTLDVATLADLTVFRNGLIIISIIYLIRYLYHRLFVRITSIAELFLSPRGLISILLYFSIPDSLKVQGLSSGLMFFVIIVTCVIMMMGLVSARENQS